MSFIREIGDGLIMAGVFLLFKNILVRFVHLHTCLLLFLVLLYVVGSMEIKNYRPPSALPLPFNVSRYSYNV